MTHQFTGRSAFRFAVGEWHRVAESLSGMGWVNVTALCGLRADSRVMKSFRVEAEIVDEDGATNDDFATGSPRCIACFPEERDCEICGVRRNESCRDIYGRPILGTHQGRHPVRDSERTLAQRWLSGEEDV